MTFIPILIWAFVIFIIIKASKKKGTNAQSQDKRTGKAAYTSMYSNYSQAKVRSAKDYSKGGMQIRDNRGNDWLSQQLREEHAAFKRTSEMFDLKREHAASCDARRVALEHYEHCDAAGVDQGELK